MKKLFCGLATAAAVAFSTPALADYDFDVMGQVAAVTPQSMTVNAMGKAMTIAVNPITKVEVEKRGFIEYDYHTSFSNVKVGDWVKVEVIPMGQGQFVAKEIEVYR